MFSNRLVKYFKKKITQEAKKSLNFEVYAAKRINLHFHVVCYKSFRNSQSNEWRHCGSFHSFLLSDYYTSWYLWLRVYKILPTCWFEILILLELHLWLLLWIFAWRITTYKNVFSDTCVLDCNCVMVLLIIIKVFLRYLLLNLTRYCCFWCTVGTHYFFFRCGVWACHENLRCHYQLWAYRPDNESSLRQQLASHQQASPYRYLF